nr:SIR2 family protein [uncultured Draconibacterium sp.]
MRKIIYKGEFDNLCSNLKASQEQRIELLKIFTDTQYSPHEYFQLRPEFFRFELLKAEIQKIIIDDDIDSHLKKVFRIQSDLDDIPAELLEAIKQKDVAVFVGAGLSKLVAGQYPLWSELANNAIGFLEEKGKINFYEKERLIREIGDPKQKLSIFEKYLENGGKRGKETTEFDEFIQQSFAFNHSKKSNYSNPYELLCSETFDFIKVTSNFDLEFAKALKKKHENPQISLDFSATDLTETSDVSRKTESYIKTTKDGEEFLRNRIYMFHGNIKNSSELVLTTEDYITEYFSDDGRIRPFLEKLFHEKTVLFISYGLAEFPILERIFSPKKDPNSKKAKRHFILLPTYFSDISYFNVQKTYFDKLGITAIPYYLDNDGFFRICKVLESWEKMIAVEPINNIDIIDSFLESGSNIENVIRVIKRDSNSLNHLFVELKDFEHWNDFKSEGIFSAERFLVPPEYQRDANQFIYTPVFYFERLSEAIGKGVVDNKRYSEDLVNMILAISSLAKEKGRELSLRTRSFFIDILSNMPYVFLSDELFENDIRRWIKGKDATDYLGYPLYARLLRSLIIQNDPRAWEKAEVLFKVAIHETLEYEIISEHYLSAAFVDNDKSKNLYKVIAEKFSNQFIKFIIREIEDFLVKKYFYTISYELDGQNRNIQVSYKGDCVFEEKLENGSGSTISFDPKGHGKELAHQVIKIVEKDKAAQARCITENFSEFGKRFYETFPDENDFSIFNDHESYDYNIKPLATILKYILKERSFTEKKFIKNLLDSFIGERHGFFVQLALFIIDGNWEFSSFIQDIMNKKTEITFEENILKNDFRIFLKRNIDKLSAEHKTAIIDKIDNGPYRYRESYKEISIKYWKLRWYNSLQADPLFKNRFDELSEGKSYSSEELDDSGRIRYYGEKTPMSPDNLNKMSNDEIIDFIRNFSPDSDSKWEMGSVKQLAVSVGQLLKINPSKFYDLLETDFTFPYVYADQIISALDENWANTVGPTLVDLPKSFNFIERYISNVLEQSESLIIQTESYVDHKTVAGDIAHFIMRGNESKDYYFPEEYWERCKAIILLLTNNIKLFEYTPPKSTFQTDNNREYTLNHSLNSDQGRIFHANFILSRRFAFATKDEDSRFQDEFRLSFSKCLASEIRDAFIIFGTYLTSYAYFDESFTLSQVKKFLNLDSENWKSFFGGWLFWDYRGYSPQLHKVLSPHYLRAIKENFDIGGLSQNSGLTRKVLVAYYWGYEELEQPVLNTFLKNSSIEKLDGLVKLVRLDYKKVKKTKEIYERIIPLWDMIIEELKNRTGTEKLKVVAETLYLSKYIETIDEKSFYRLMFVLESDCESVGTRAFLKDLKRFLKKDDGLETCNYICSLIELIINKYYPRPDEDLKSLLTNLFELRRKELNEPLKRICNSIIEINEGYISWPAELVKKYLDH